LGRKDGGHDRDRENGLLDAKERENRRSLRSLPDEKVPSEGGGAKLKRRAQMLLRVGQRGRALLVAIPGGMIVPLGDHFTRRKRDVMRGGYSYDIYTCAVSQTRGKPHRRSVYRRA
jgi:hypothetical protein